ncbi:MAG: Arc family DNA-binding protein [Clostridia bacterium]|nr:Arc family DNA-binding protein [Clostridia bacterium]
MAIKSYSVRIDEELLDKLHVVAEYEGRSANKQIIMLVREAVAKYEAKYGEIKIGGSKNKEE